MLPAIGRAQLFPLTSHYFCIVKVNSSTNRLPASHRTFVRMKQLVAILFLIAYSLTSIGAPAAMHQCGTQQHAVHYTTSECSHLAITSLPVCNTGQPVCTVAKDESSIALATIKELTKPFKVLPAALHSVQVENPASLSLTSAKGDVPTTVYKVRLHLYKRVLLI